MIAMTKQVTVDFIWIPPDLGGHRHSPYLGMRLSMRWQQFIDAHLKRTRDVQCNDLVFTESSRRGLGVFTLISNDGIPDEFFHPGQLIELLSGFRVLAVGRILKHLTKSR
jgi:hypothetical protein